MWGLVRKREASLLREVEDKRVRGGPQVSDTNSGMLTIPEPCLCTNILFFFENNYLFLLTEPFRCTHLSNVGTRKIYTMYVLGKWGVSDDLHLSNRKHSSNVCL